MNHQFMTVSDDRSTSQIYSEDAFVAHLGSTHSSPERFDEESGMLVNGNGWQQHVPPHLPTAPASAGSNTSSVPAKIDGLPQQKRRRVTRACDECRRKKIKCDGKQPCTHCTVYSYGSCVSLPGR